MKTCYYCNTDISHLHWKSKHCKSNKCQDLFDAERLERVKKANEKHNRKRPAVTHYKKPRNTKYGPYRCRYCHHRLPKDGNRFYCNDKCRESYLGLDRSDGDWLLA